MKIIRPIIRHASLLNALLLIIFVITAVSVFLPLTKMNLKYSLPKVEKKTSAEEKKQAEKGGAPTPADFAVIGEMNLFHPERITPAEKKAELPKPELVLYATMVSDEAQFAFIEDKKNPGTTPGRGKRQTVIKKGDAISGFVVTEIAPDRIVLVRGDEQMTVRLSEGEKRKGGNGASTETTPAPLTKRRSPERPTPQARPAAAVPMVPRQNQPLIKN